MGVSGAGFCFLGPAGSLQWGPRDQGPGRSLDRGRVVIRRLPLRPTRTCDEPESTVLSGWSTRSSNAPRYARWPPIRSSGAGDSSTVGSGSAGACAGPRARAGLHGRPRRRHDRPGTLGGHACPMVQVLTDHPVSACLASQYAGWAISEEKYFAMGSGPMRCAGLEPIFARSGFASRRFGRRRPRDSRAATPSVVSAIAVACEVAPSAVTLLVATTASLAGGLQVVARSVETPSTSSPSSGSISPVSSRRPAAPLPPVAGDDMAAIGRTNDAVLYGARVVLWVTGDDDSLDDRLAPRCRRPPRERRAVRLDLHALQSRFLRGRSAPLQPRGGCFNNLDTGRTSMPSASWPRGCLSAPSLPDALVFLRLSFPPHDQTGGSGIRHGVARTGPATERGGRWPLTLKRFRFPASSAGSEPDASGSKRREST